jgi:hypothetical protein
MSDEKTQVEKDLDSLFAAARMVGPIRSAIDVPLRRWCCSTAALIGDRDIVRPEHDALMCRLLPVRNSPSCRGRITRR